jgi:hypothetical protein
MPRRKIRPIRDALRIQPIQPFDLKMVDGSTVHVGHPDRVIIPPVERPRDLWFFEVGPPGEDYRTHWLDPATAGVRELRGHLNALIEILAAARPLGLSHPIQLVAALGRYADALSEARRRLALLFDRQEWNLMADVMNGCLNLQDWTGQPCSTAALLLANVQDGHALDGTGYKWFGEEDRAESDRRMTALTTKLMKLTPIEADAIGQAIREFWDNCETVNPATDRWWLPRREPRARGRS